MERLKKLRKKRKVTDNWLTELVGTVIRLLTEQFVPSVNLRI